MNITINQTINGTITYENTDTNITIAYLVLIIILLAVFLPLFEYIRYYCINIYRNKVFVDYEYHDTTEVTNTEQIL